MLPNIQTKSLKITSLLKAPPESYNTAVHQQQAERYIPIVKKYLPKYYTATLMPIVHSFGHKIESQHFRNAINGFSTTKKYYVLLVVLQHILDSGFPIPNLDDFPEWFQADYIKINE